MYSNCNFDCDGGGGVGLSSNSDGSFVDEDIIILSCTICESEVFWVFNLFEFNWKAKHIKQSHFNCNEIN